MGSVAMNSNYGVSRELSALQNERALYHPELPPCLQVGTNIIASVSPNNSDVQYQVMLEHRVLRRLCVQKIVVDTPMKGKLDKDKHFRMMEDGSHVLAKSV